MDTSILIRTYARDGKWLRYCLRGLRKFARGFREIVVVSPDNIEGVDFAGARFMNCPALAPADYIGQQITKTNADKYCHGDYILHMDSDCIAQNEFAADDFTRDGQPYLLFRKWADVGDAQCWREPTKQAIGAEPCFEFMAAMPIIYHRSTHELFRAHVAALHGKPCDDYIAAQERFSEFNALGNYAHQHTPDAYRFIRATGPADGFPRPLKQYWSHAPWAPEFEAELEAHTA